MFSTDFFFKYETQNVATTAKPAKPTISAKPVPSLTVNTPVVAKHKEKTQEPPTPKPKASRISFSESDSDSDSDSESDSKPEKKMPPMKPAKTKPVRKLKVVQSDDEDEVSQPRVQAIHKILSKPLHRSIPDIQPRKTVMSQLWNEARKKNITGFNRMKKADLEKAIKDAT